MEEVDDRLSNPSQHYIQIIKLPKEKREKEKKRREGPK